MFRLLLITLLVLAASACGQKGALYLPENDSLALGIPASAIALNAH